MNYNPYELVKMVINGKPIDGRPIEFDSEPVSQKTMRNAFGSLVKPSKVVTVCPDCSQGLIISIKLPDPPFQPVQQLCPYCRPAPLPLADPFINPLDTGRVPIAELDPMLHNPDRPLSEAAGVVADRFRITPGPSAPAAVPTDVPAQADADPGDLILDEILNQMAREEPLQKAEGLDEEIDFDDSEMVEE